MQFIINKWSFFFTLISYLSYMTKIVVPSSSDALRNRLKNKNSSHVKAKQSIIYYKSMCETFALRFYLPDNRLQRERLLFRFSTVNYYQHGPKFIKSFFSFFFGRSNCRLPTVFCQYILNC